MNDMNYYMAKVKGDGAKAKVREIWEAAYAAGRASATPKRGENKLSEKSDAAFDRIHKLLDEIREVDNRINNITNEIIEDYQSVCESERKLIDLSDHYVAQYHEKDGELRQAKAEINSLREIA